MRDEAERFDELGARVVLIGLGRPEQAADFCGRRRVLHDCVVQPDRGAHKAFGLRRGTVNQTLGPAVWLPWLRNMVTGNPQGKFGQGDVAQLAGTFVVDAGGVVRYVHRAGRVSDVPPSNEIVQALANLKEST